MYSNRPNLYIGFHGCDESVRDQLALTPNSIKISEKPFDWLVHGFYVWENNYDRALKWAKDKEKTGKIGKASVVGVVYTLDNCLDFTDSLYIDALEIYYAALKEEFEAIDKNLPINKDVPSDQYKDKLLRDLDCMVIEYMHQRITVAIEEGSHELRCFDSSRGVFTEGGPTFDGAGIQKKNHIQICIRNKNCIKAFFIPRKEIKFP